MISDNVFGLHDAMIKVFSETKPKLSEILRKHSAYCRSKALTKPLIFSYSVLNNPKMMTQSDSASVLLPIWLAFYRAQKILSNSEYKFRKFGTNYVECVYRIRLTLVIPKFELMISLSLKFKTTFVILF